MYTDAYYPVTNNRISLSYAQHFSLMDKALRIIPSLQLTYGQVSAHANGKGIDDLDMILLYRQLQQSQPKAYASASAGLLINYRHLYAGVSVAQFNQPDIGLLGYKQLPASLSAHISYNLRVSEKTMINFSGSCFRQNARNSAQVNVSAVFFSHLLAGLGYLSNAGETDNSLLLRLGYRANYFSVTAYMRQASISASNIQGDFGFTASFNLRKQELRKKLTDFETW